MFSYNLHILGKYGTQVRIYSIKMVFFSYKMSIPSRKKKMTHGKVHGQARLLLLLVFYLLVTNAADRPNSTGTVPMNEVRPGKQVTPPSPPVPSTTITTTSTSARPTTTISSPSSEDTPPPPSAAAPPPPPPSPSPSRPHIETKTPVATEVLSTPPPPKAAEPVLVPDDEDLIDDNNWETGVPSVHGSTQPHNVATGRSGPSVLPLLTKMLLTLLSLVSCSLFVWYWGGGRVQIGKMIANKEVGRPKGT